MGRKATFFFSNEQQSSGLTGRDAYLESLEIITVRPIFRHEYELQPHSKFERGRPQMKVKSVIEKQLSLDRISLQIMDK